MLHKLSFALLFAVLTYGQIASAQFSLPGKCPAIKPMEKFIWPNFEGIWFEYARYPIKMETGLDCVHSTYRSISNDTIGLRVSGFDPSNHKVYLDATINILGSGLMCATFIENGPKQTYKILDTDYNFYAVMYSCQEAGDMREESAWILTRLRNPDEKTVGKAMAVLGQKGVSTDHLRNTRQRDCPKQIE